MDLLHNFLTQKCKFDGQDFSFKSFCKEWKSNKMNYIFLIKHKNEPLSNFMNECNEYLTNCIYYNFIKRRETNIDYQLSTYCIYILYVLITQQPCFEDNSSPSYIYLPEYIWDSLKQLINYSLIQNKIDLKNILKHMMKNSYFIYCLERPISYSTSRTDPYSKNGKVYCHGTRSRIKLIPNDLVSVMDLPMLSSHKNKYKQALKKCGILRDNDNDSNNNDDQNSDNHNGNKNESDNDPFITQLRDIRSLYQQQIVKLQKHRTNGHVKYQISKSLHRF